MERKILSKAELINLSDQIAEIEKSTSAEIRVVVRHKKHWTERKLDARKVAEREFVSLGMIKTKDRTGILVFILVSERTFELLADVGVISVLPAEFWTATAQRLSEHFSKRNFFEGLKNVLSEIGIVLKEKLPPAGDNPEELPNDVIEE